MESAELRGATGTVEGHAGGRIHVRPADHSQRGIAWRECGASFLALISSTGRSAPVAAAFEFRRLATTRGEAGHSTKQRATPQRIAAQNDRIRRGRDSWPQRCAWERRSWRSARRRSSWRRPRLLPRSLPTTRCAMRCVDSNMGENDRWSVTLIGCLEYFTTEEHCKFVERRFSGGPEHVGIVVERPR